MTYRDMETRLKFFKQDGKWYADVPNRTLEENEMVLGSDFALDIIAESFGKDEIWLTMTDSEPRNYLLGMGMKEHDDDGAWYSLYGQLFNQIMLNFDDDPANIIQEVWVCNVTHDVFGEHPNNIYITEING